MPSLKLKEVEITNWMRIKSARVTFPENGLVAVIGVIGAGKTSLGEAIMRSTFGMPGRFTYLKDCLHRDFKKEVYVKTSWELGGSPLTVELGYKSSKFEGKGEGLRFTHSEVIERPNPADTRQELNRIVGINPQLSEWSVFIDGDTLKFNRISQEEAVNMLLAALNQDSWSTKYRQTLKIAAKAEKSLELSKGRLNQAAASLSDRRENLRKKEIQITAARKLHTEAVNKFNVRARELAEELKKEKNYIESLRNERKTAADEIARLNEANATQLHNFDVKRGKLTSDIAIISEEIEALIEKKTGLKSVHDDCVDNHSALLNEPEKCRACNQPLPKTVTPEQIEKAAQDMAKAGRQLDEVAGELKKKTERRENLKAQLNELNEQARAAGTGSKISALSHTVQETEAKIDRRLSIEEEIKEDIARHEQNRPADPTARLETEANVYKEQIKELEAEIEKRQQETDEANATHEVITYWAKGFSPAGIPNLILESAITPLSESAWRISTALSNGKTRVQYKTSTALASGETRPRLLVEAENVDGSQKLEGNSKGEGRLANLVIAESIADVGRVASRIGFRWYDEVLNSQHAGLRQDILTYLKELARTQNMLICVADHHPETASFADHILMTTKGPEGTVYEWVNQTKSHGSPG